MVPVGVIPHRRVVTVFCCGLWLAMSACRGADPGERPFSSKLSAELLIPGETILDPAARAGRLEVYSSPPEMRGLVSPAEVRRHRFLYETRDPDAIRSLILSAQDALSGECNTSDSPVVLHVMAFDERADEVGSIRIFPCAGTADVAIMAYGDNAVVYSTILRPVLKELGIQ